MRIHYLKLCNIAHSLSFDFLLLSKELTLVFSLKYKLVVWVLRAVVGV